MSTRDDLFDIGHLIVLERQARDRGWWPQMRQAYAPNSEVKLSWYRGDGPGFVAASEGMSAEGDSAVHRLSPPAVHVRHDRAIAEMPCGVELRVHVRGVAAHLVSYTRLNYRLVRQADSWLVTRLDAIYERDVLIPESPSERPDVPTDAMTGTRPSYALLAYCLRSKGYDITDDLLGDDQPDHVDRFYNDARRWLNAAASGFAVGAR